MEGKEVDDLGLSYEDAMHGVQSALTLEIITDEHKDDNDWRYKDLRTGTNSAHVTDAAIARLLIEKGIFTEAEYVEAVRREANRELIRYEKKHGVKFR